MTHKNRTNFERVRIKLGKWKRKLLSFFYEGIYIAYYKLFFGRNFPLSRKIGTFVNSWEKRQRKGDIPLLREVWNFQYQSGCWDFMKELDELARYSVIAGYLKYFKHITSILDIGCGDGILIENLDPTSYSKYLGIDISDAAIRLSSQKEYLRTSFIAADAANFIPKEQFDAIVFNESLYYFDDPLLITEKYAQYLNKGGIFITSMFVVSKRARSTLALLKTKYVSVDEITIKSGPRTWNCNIFLPSGEPSLDKSND